MLLNLTVLHMGYMIVMMGMMPVMVTVRMVMLVTRNDSREDGFPIPVRLRILMIVGRNQVRGWRGIRVPDKIILRRHQPVMMMMKLLLLHSCLTMQRVLGVRGLLLMWMGITGTFVR